MPDKMNLDYLKLLYCEFQKDEVMNMSVVGGQPKKTRKFQLKSNKTHRTHFSNLWLFLVYVIKSAAYGVVFMSCLCENLNEQGTSE